MEDYKIKFDYSVHITTKNNISADKIKAVADALQKHLQYVIDENFKCTLCYKDGEKIKAFNADTEVNFISIWID